MMLNKKNNWLSILIAAFLFDCAPHLYMSVLVQMQPDQEKYFKNEAIAEFQKQNCIHLDVFHYDNTDSLESYVKQNQGSAGLVKIPFDRASSLISEGELIPLDSILSPGEMKQFKSTFLLTSMGEYNNKQYVIPRKFETRVMVYCKSKVADALLNWRQYYNQIDLEMKRYNGYGLPATYVLETDPNEWDYFDIFVVGWVWAHTAYNGKTTPRIAHRGKWYSGTSLRLVDRIYQLGGDSAQIVTMSGDAVVDAFYWESLYAAGKIFNPRMWEEKWSGSDIWKGFKTGEVFLSFMTQLDCFFLHGTRRDNLNGYFEDPDDVGVALMPQGCSVDLDCTGKPLRAGKKTITTGGWWWGIPLHSPDPQKSFKLAMHLSGTASQIEECTRFGMIPVRKDILGDISMLFGGGWISDIYDVSLRQLILNGSTRIPQVSGFKQITSTYLDLWYDIIVERNFSADKSVPDREYIKQLIAGYSMKKSNF
ncbi:MAG: hypothetical protein GX640_14325 [Fibrobacter sp.]|nr:hypothetical protein [Fibrobacter sp.]